MAEVSEGACSNQVADMLNEEIDELSVSRERADEDDNINETIFIDSIDSVRKVNFETLDSNDILRYEFSSLQVAYAFYNSYGRKNGFGIRKYKMGRSVDKTILWQTFVCCRQGFREAKYCERVDRKRDSKPVSRCGCEAQFRVHVDITQTRWYVSEFVENHNHELIDVLISGMVRSQRKMSEANVGTFNTMKKAGINTNKVHAFFAVQYGSYHKILFGKKQMYNHSSKQRRMGDGDANEALKFLRQLKSTVDPMLYYKHVVDSEGLLHHLFWVDGRCQADYEAFGDVLAFDATYGRNQYKCPLVVFSGVNHHLQTIVFGSALVSDETEETYAWLLDNLLEAMKGKCPQSVITDGDLAMRNAIRRVFPEAHHRLCGWHLIRNATSNVCKTKFTTQFSKCMLNDYEVDEFEEKWHSVVNEFDLHDNNWVQDMYEKKGMWATAHMRGHFFAGLRTTSRCEALHSQMGRYVEPGHNITEFLTHFNRCLDYMRCAEMEAEYDSVKDFPMMSSHLKDLEHSAASIYTRPVFERFRVLLSGASSVNIDDYTETTSTIIFYLSKYRIPGKTWHVCYCPATVEMKCSCQRMESVGIPCVHIVRVLVHLHFGKLPESLILKRWTLKAKEGITVPRMGGCGSKCEDSAFVARLNSMHDSWRELTPISCRDLDDFNDTMDIIAGRKKELLAKYEKEIASRQGSGQCSTVNLKDPKKVRTKGCGKSTLGTSLKRKRTMRCSFCGSQGHNCRCCPEKEKLEDIHVFDYEENLEDDE